jgi:tetratricopeptide (TPR) repeat protein
MAKMVLKSYEEMNKSRKKSRIILVLLSIPFIIAIGLFGIKAYMMYSQAGTTISTYEKKDFNQSAIESAKQKENNLFEPWLAYYNLGTSYAAEEKYNEAEPELVKALGMVENSLKQCFVRSNLAIVYEKQGDTATSTGNQAESENRYALAQKVIEEAPEECFPPSSGGKGKENSETSDAGEDMDETSDRVGDKQDEAKGEEGDEGNETPESPKPEESGTDKIEEQLEQSNTDRTNKENSERGENLNGSRESVDKPW